MSDHTEQMNAIADGVHAGEAPCGLLITGAGRGMGVEFVRAALAAGHNVVATGRNLDTVRSAVGRHERLLVTELDIIDARSAERAVAAAVARFGRIDVLVNNAGNFFGGFFEELSPQQLRSQIETNLFGPMTWRAGWRAWPARSSPTGSAP